MLEAAGETVYVYQTTRCHIPIIFTSNVAEDKSSVFHTLLSFVPDGGDV